MGSSMQCCYFFLPSNEKKFLVDNDSTEFTELANYLTGSHGTTHSIKYNVSTDSKKRFSRNNGI